MYGGGREYEIIRKKKKEKSILLIGNEIRLIRGKKGENSPANVPSRNRKKVTSATWGRGEKGSFCSDSGRKTRDSAEREGGLRHSCGGGE